MCWSTVIDERMFPSSYVGSDYFCENGNPGEGAIGNPGAWEIILYVSDHSEMVKGVLVHGSPPCCEINYTWLHGVTAPGSASSCPRLQLMCRDYYSDEDNPVELIEFN